MGRDGNGMGLNAAEYGVLVPSKKRVEYGLVGRVNNWYSN